ncbi:hypothetical protein EAO27_00300 [Sphingopyxis sp. YF1]|uniref:hypothetical protein n=1 Tax=Sphingopyxis sp. YF1 TaxID=2482763 RepID=UPI001F62235A|nr:hypothetical protein [Sphingopyxis sp. YF1]UNU41316.1 hypothetical protein EAO27_00300 [Sphingopyxis sp. YF1]
MHKAPFLLALPLLLGAAPTSAAPELCEREAANEPHIAPIAVVELSRDGITLANDMVVAHEVALVARRGWLLGETLRVPGSQGLIFPAGTPLEPDYMGDTGALCLPIARPPFTAPPGEEKPRWSPIYYEACLADADRDGRHERIDVYRGNSAMHVPRRELLHSEPLAVPQRLAPNPLGRADSRRYAHRRVTAYVRGTPEKGKELRLGIAHAWQDHDDRTPPGVWTAGADGTHVYRLVPHAPPPVVMTGYNYRSSEQESGARVTIADGAEVVVGGLRFRLVERWGSGWALLPLAGRFPPWIRYGCEGKSVILGAAPPAAGE